MTELPAQPEDQPRPPVDWTQREGPTAAKGSARTRSQWAIAIIAIAGVLGAIAAVQDVLGLGVMRSAFAGTLSDGDAQAFDSTFAAVGTAQFVVLIAAAVAFLSWLSRSVDNVPRLTGERPTFTPGWSIAWWFIPFANFVMPYQVVSDLYRRMAPISRIAAPIIGLWWVIWIVGNIASNVASRLYLAGDDMAELTFALQLYAFGDASDPIAAVLIIVIIVRIQGWADAREPGPAVASPPDGTPAT